MRVSTYDQGQQDIVFCLTEPGPIGGFTRFSVASIPHPLTPGFRTLQPTWRVQPVGFNECPHC